MAESTVGDTIGNSAAGRDQQARFAVTPAAGPRPATVRAAGDIDLANAAEFRVALTEAAATSREVTADLTAVTYCDSVAIHALLTTARRNRLTVIVPEAGPITTMLKIAGLDQVAAVITSLEPAPYESRRRVWPGGTP